MKEMCLSDRMKMYENLNKQYLMPNQYVLMRLDGRAFSKFTKRFFNKPFDEKFTQFMNETMLYLVDDISGCVAGYTQSDEITLLLTDKKNKGQEGWFNYRLDKMCSIAASMATAYFNHNFCAYLDNTYYADKYPFPVFDCRIWQVPNDAEVKNVFLWRQRDCIRNSILQYSQSIYSHNEMMNKNVDQLKEMLRDRGYNWDDLGCDIKYGTFYFPKVGCMSTLIGDSGIQQQFDNIFNDVYEW